jgi:hypothetical protein
MKSIALAILLAAPGYALDIDRMLYAIAQVESGGNHAAIGKAGERSQYQMTAATWRRYTRAPFKHATKNPVLARMVARAHVQYLMKRVGARGGMAYDPMQIALGWNPGDLGYSARVANIYSDK